MSVCESRRGIHVYTNTTHGDCAVWSWVTSRGHMPVGLGKETGERDLTHLHQQCLSPDTIQTLNAVAHNVHGT